MILKHSKSVEVRDDIMSYEIGNFNNIEFFFLEIIMKCVLSLYIIEHNEGMCNSNISGKEFTLLWLRDYKTYWWEALLYDFDYFSDDTITLTTTTSPVSKQETKFGKEMIDYSKLNDFLSSPLYKHWKKFLKLR